MADKPTYEELEQRVKDLEKDDFDRKRVEESLLREKNFSESIIDSLPGIFYFFDDTGKLLRWNKNFEKVSGYSAEEISKMSPLDFFELEDKKEVAKKIQEVFIKEKSSVEANFVSKNGNRTPYYFTGLRLIIGNTHYLVGMGIDISERKLFEEALEESEKRFRSIIEGTEAGYFFTDQDGCFQNVNDAWLRMHHYSSSDEVIGQHFSLTQINCDMEAANNNVKRLLGGEHLPAGEFSRRCKDGSIGYHTFTVSPVVHGGEIIGLEGFIIDITNKKELEAQLRQAHKMEAIGTLAGGIAHDFNNILGIILGNTELAMDDVPEWNPARFNLEEIKTASLRAKDVVRQILSFARKTDQERKPVKINPIVTGSLKLLRSSIPSSIEIRSNIPKESQTILADPTQINQMLINLCTNAAHAMEKDGGILEISLDRVTMDELMAQSYALSPGRYVKIAVCDTGHGIKPEIKDRIFDPYFTTKEVGKGSGMGLAVVHGIVMNHDGAIFVDSELEKGTTFNIFFPVTEREPISEIPIDEDLPTGKERILFVDDEKSIMTIGHQRLERLGYKVESTTSPSEALDLFRLKPDQFDLVITDMTMPQMTGDKLVKEILSIRPDIPIIICTGFCEKINGEKATEIGANGYLEKSLDKRDLAITVRQVLDRK
jgi:PAS domain S-box-containing protein